jgi:hypothetical protein
MLYLITNKLYRVKALLFPLKFQNVTHLRIYGSFMFALKVMLFFLHFLTA